MSLLSLLPDLQKCECGCVRGDHRSTSSTSFNLHPVRYGGCRYCDCHEFTPADPDDETGETGR
jgi:hypothetical protein